MSASLLRGLRILEMLQEEPVGISEIARRLEVDKAGVSRVMAALHREGWVARTGRRFVLGERALRLADEPAAPVLALATDLATGLREATGHTAVVLQQRGAAAQPLAISEAVDEAARTPFNEAPEPFEHLLATAGGIALLAQLPDDVVDEHLAVDPWPLTSPGAPRDAGEVRQRVADVRAGAVAVEQSWTAPGQACLALPWPGHPRPMAVAVLGPQDALTEAHDPIVAHLRRAVAPG